MIKTVDDLVEALGGTGAVARIVGVVDGAVSQWRAAGKIPPANYLLLRKALAAIDKDVLPSLFNFKEASE